MWQVYRKLWCILQGIWAIFDLPLSPAFIAFVQKDLFFSVVAAAFFNDCVCHTSCQFEFLDFFFNFQRGMLFADLSFHFLVLGMAIAQADWVSVFYYGLWSVSSSYSTHQLKFALGSGWDRYSNGVQAWKASHSKSTPFQSVHRTHVISGFLIGFVK